MRRLFFPLALWLYVSLDRALYGAGMALYFDSGWEMALIWLSSAAFVVMVAYLIWSDPQSKRQVPLAPALPNVKEAAWNLLLLSIFTCFLLSGLRELEQWWREPFAEMPFRLAFACLQFAFWCIAGRWWRDALQMLVALLQKRQSR